MHTLPLIWLGYAAIGALSGMLAGTFGIGGGFVVIPALLVVFGLQGVDPEVAMHLAIGTSLASIVVSGTAAALSHHRHGNVLLHRLRQLLPGLLGGAILGVFVASSLSGGTLRAAFGTFLVLLAMHRLSGWPRLSHSTLPGAAPTVLAGGVIGGTSALFGIGCGMLAIPWLGRCGASLKQAIGTAAACGAPTALVGTVTFVLVGWGHPALPPGATGYVMWPALLGIILASIPFAHIGARVARTTSPTLLGRLFALLMLCVGLRLLASELL